jgi:hypothetical protein
MTGGHTDTQFEVVVISDNRGYFIVVDHIFLNPSSRVRLIALISL